jgi:hypothetical protein
MKRLVSVCTLLLVAAAGSAENEAAAPVPAPAPAAAVSATDAPASLPAAPASSPAASGPAESVPNVRPRGVAPGLAAANASPSAGAGTAAGSESTPALFTAEEKWGLAGYNNNEPIYTILVTSHDARIMRCTADLKGTYIENGEKQSITDRQTITVFPNQQVQMGNWSGMDQQSGATYSVKCRPV